MPDGGMAENFQQVAGLVQALVGNGGMRPFMVVGIENTERRRAMTGPRWWRPAGASRRAWAGPRPSGPSSAPS
jgi:hypothetical protein